MASSSSFASTLALIALVVLQLSCTTIAETIDVTNWWVPYVGPNELTANVGDTIVFRWEVGHNVYIHPTMDCSLNDAIFVGAISPTEYTFTEADGSLEGTDMFFSCDIGNGAHCRAGQNLIVTVNSGDGPSSEYPTFPPSFIATGVDSSEDSGLDLDPEIGTPIIDTVPTIDLIPNPSNISDIIDNNMISDIFDNNITFLTEFDVDDNITYIDETESNETESYGTDVTESVQITASNNAIVDSSINSSSNSHQSYITIAIGLVSVVVAILLV